VPLIAPAATWLNLVAKVGSIRRAAAQLNVSPSAVNRRILNLEAEYGAALFERLPRGLRLTPAGTRLVADIERWQHDHARAVEDLAQLGNLVRGRASIGLMESFSRAVVSRLMTHMAERRFQASLDICVGGTDHIVGRLVAGKLDLAICYAVPRHPEIQVLARAPSTPGIVVARGHPLANRKTIRLADCAGCSFVFPDASLTVRGILDAAFRRANIEPTGVVTTNSIEIMKTLVRDHQQVALLARPDVHPDLIDGDLVHIPFADASVRGSSLSLIARRHTSLSPAALLVADNLKEQLLHLAGR
jgi:DNA-binding transcriptional LysR family regulator